MFGLFQFCVLVYGCKSIVFNEVWMYWQFVQVCIFFVDCEVGFGEIYIDDMIGFCLVGNQFGIVCVGEQVQYCFVWCFSLNLLVCGLGVKKQLGILVGVVGLDQIFCFQFVGNVWLLGFFKQGGGQGVGDM